MKQAHIVLQGKGGIGKTYVSGLLMQNLTEAGRNPQGIDTDPVNATLHNYKALNTIHLAITKDGIVDPRAFDSLMDMLMESVDNSTFVIDTGATTFLPINHYLLENDIFNLLKEKGVEMIVHAVLAGGQALEFTSKSVGELFEYFPAAPMVIWLNEHFGSLEVNGKTFEQTKLYKERVDQIRGIVKLPNQSGSTFGYDIKQMTDNSLTFGEIGMDDRFTGMATHRLDRVWRDINQKITSLNL